ADDRRDLSESHPRACCIGVDGRELVCELPGEPDLPAPACGPRQLTHVHALCAPRSDRDRIRGAAGPRDARQVARRDRRGLADFASSLCSVSTSRSTSAVGLLVAVLACATPTLASQRTGWMMPPEEENDTSWGILDLGRLIGVPDTYALVSASNRAGNSLSRDIPNFFAVQEIFGGQTTRLVHLALEKITAGGHLSLVGGRIDALDDFATSPLYCYA